MKKTNAFAHRRYSTKPIIRWFWIACVFLLCMMQCASINATENSELNIVPIANVAAPTEKLNLNQLRAVFALHQLSWDNGVPIQIVIFPIGNDKHRQFTTKYLSIMPYQLERAWARMKFKGLMRSSIIVQTEEEMIEVVSSMPGAIGYVSDKMLTATKKKIRRILE